MQLPSSIFNYTILQTEDQIRAIRDEWNRLLQHLPDFLPTMTYEWHMAWLQSHKDQIRNLYFLLFRDRHDELIAIIPLIKIESQIFLAHLNVYTFSGARDQIKTGIICRKEHQIAVQWQTIRHFYQARRDWDILALRRLSSSKADNIVLERILHRYHYPYSIESFLRIPYIQLDQDWETYWKTRKKHFRHEIKRKTKKLQEKGSLGFEVFEAPFKEEIFDQFVRLENSGWKGKNRSSLKYRPALRKLFQNLVSSSSNILQLLVFNLNLNQTTISSSICLRTPHGLYVFKIAYDEAYSKYSPGLLLRLHEIQYCYAKGLKIYDFSGREQPWMRAFTRRGHYVMDYIIYRKTAASLIRYLGFTKIRPLIKHSHFTERLLKNFIEE